MRVIREVFAVVGVVSWLGLACGGERTAPGADPAPVEASPLPLPPPQVLSICPLARTYLQDGSLHEEQWLDAQGRVTHWLSRGPEGGIESERHSVYDTAGREVRRVTRGIQGEQISTWEYTADGRLLSRYSLYPLEGELFAYGEGGHPISVQTLRGGHVYSVQSFDFDHAGHVLRATTQRLSDGGQIGLTTFDYGEDGVLKSSYATDLSVGGTKSTFDPAGRVLSEESDFYHGHYEIIQYTYDDLGRLTAHQSRRVNYTDSHDYPTRESKTLFAFDAQGRLARQEEQERVHENRGTPDTLQHFVLVFTYAPQLVRVDRTDENGVPEGSRELSYDASGRLSEEHFSGAMAQQQGFIQHTYSPCGDAQ